MKGSLQDPEDILSGIHALETLASCLQAVLEACPLCTDFSCASRTGSRAMKPCIGCPAYWTRNPEWLRAAPLLMRSSAVTAAVAANVI